MQKVIKSVKQRSTLLNFFSCGGNKPLPLPAREPEPKKPSQKVLPKKTRCAKFDRPLKVQEPALARQEARQEKVQKLCKSIKRKFAAGTLSVSPKKRKEWSGSVCIVIVI